MRISVNAKTLLTACQLAAGATAARSTMPILSCVKLEADGGDLAVSATDTEVGIRYIVPDVDVREGGSTVVSPDKLIGILRECNGDSVAISADGQACTVKTDAGTFKLAVQPVADFPAVEVGDDQGVYIDTAKLANAFRRTAYAMDKKEGTRWAVTGLMLDYDDGRLVCVGTDTRRLAMVNAECTKATAKWTGLVPSKAISLVEKHLHLGEKVSVGATKNQANFVGSNWYVTTKLIEGKFPPYDQIIPKKYKHSFMVNREQFASRLRLAKIMTDEETKRVDFDFTGGMLTMTARGAETGSSEVTMPVEFQDGFNIAFDPDYVLQFLASVADCETVQVNLIDGAKPAVFKAGEDCTYLVMPMGG